MRSNLVLFFCLLLIAGCSCHKTQMEASAESFKANTLPFFKGVWVLSEYIKEVDKTKSPLKASPKLKGNVSLVIEEKIKGDSLEIGSSWNNHEGSSFFLRFKNGQKINSFLTNLIDYEEKTNRYELAYEVGKKDTSLILYHYNDHMKVLDKKRFSKIRSSKKSSDLESGLQFIVNKKLFAGRYTSTDSTGKTSKIQFKSDGTVSGFKDYKTYYVKTDFIAPDEKGAPADEIFFNLDSSSPTSYLFTISSGTITLKLDKKEIVLKKAK